MISLTENPSEERLQHLNKLDTIFEKQCKPCSSDYGQGECDRCPYYKQIDQIGKELMNLTKISRLSRGIKSSNDCRSGRPEEPLKLTVAEYLKFKNTGKVDADIAKDLGCSRKRLTAFKQQNHLGNTRPVKKK